MIILKHLTIERFRLLREMNLHFPQRGSILIQGPNEAGKSALLESIYFALYGELLASGRGKRSLDDLVLYGAANASVTLTLAIGATELTIARTIERGVGQKVALYISKLGMPEEEPITELEAANQRIIAESGYMDGETLRNSCLIEQKGLNRLETISGVQRDATARKLLGLERLNPLIEHFKVTSDDEQLLQDAAERLRLAEIQARIPALDQQLDDIEAALDAVVVYNDLEEIAQQEAEAGELERAIEQILARRQDLKSQVVRIQQLKKADATLGEIIAAYDDIADARREIPELEKQMAELERLEQEELPKFEKRANELTELTRSFGTLQRMSNDLLTAVDTIKELEQELKQQNEAKNDLKDLDEQIAHARSRLMQTQQSLNDLEERRRAGKPQLEARLQRLNALTDRLAVMRQTEEQYTRRLTSKVQAQESQVQQRRLLKDLRDTEHELELVEDEARHIQEQSEELEKTWRKVSLRRQVEEWQRLKGLSQGLTQAQYHLAVAYQHKEALVQAERDAHSAASRHLTYMGSCVIGFFICLVAALSLLQPAFGFSIAAMVVMLLLIGVGIAHFQGYRQARAEEAAVNKQAQEAVNQVKMVEAAREAAARMVGNEEALLQVENEIRSLGGNVPASAEEAQQFLEQTRVMDNLGDVQQQMKERLTAVNAARNQVNVTMEAVAALRKEYARVEEQRVKEDWDNIEENLRNDQAAVERMQQEITLLAGQEGLPLPSINARLQASPIARASSFSSGPLLPVEEEDTTGVPDLEDLVESTIKATEREIASLDGKLDLVADLVAQAKLHQEALDVLLGRQRVIEERNTRYQTNNPDLQVERAREQQVSLRSALQSLQDSLRQRVKPLGIAFGQTAINNAEIAARKQLEELHITLGNRVMLQEQHSDYSDMLQERQESLSELYKQLAKYSNTLGSWIVPLNPFPEALATLRVRCQKEIKEANETSILKELETLQGKEGASKAKVQLCQQEIEEAQGRIVAMLVQRNRPKPRSYSRADLMAIWPLLGEYTAADRSSLEEKRETLEKELSVLEKQELEMSRQLGLESEPLDLELAQARMEQQERSYQTKKRGNLLLKAVSERLLHKVVPRSEYYMQQILPLLTSGRYHDVHLTTELEEGVSSGSFQLQVWDSAAGEYVSNSALSGGAADQLSLALRMAFAIATLPREVNAAAGFVFLDEPLSSFDRGRTKALVDVVTGESLGQHFEQIILISHSNAFDPTMFPYHIYMDNGMIVESNLPVVASLPAPVLNGRIDVVVPVTEPVQVASPASVAVD